MLRTIQLILGFRIGWRLLFLLAAALFAFACVYQWPPSPDPMNDKLQHFIAFVILSFLGVFSWPAASLRIVLMGSLLVFGALIEFVQSFLSWRSAELLDLVADAGGILVGTLIATTLWRGLMSADRQATR